MKMMKQLLCLLFLSATGLQAQTTFNPGDAIAVTKPGPGDSAGAYTIYTSGNVLNPTAFTAGASFDNGKHLNGFGFNRRDSLLYGAAYTGDTLLAASLLNVSLYRLDASGTVKNLGKLPTSGQSNTISVLGGIRAEIPNYTAGMVDTNGRYYYFTVGVTQAGITKLANAWVSYSFGGTQQPNPGLVLADLRLYLCWINNVQDLDSTNMPSTVAGYRRIDFSDPSATASVQMLVDDLNATFPRVGHLNGGMQDFARSPLDNALYGYISYPTGDTAGDSIAGRPVVLVGTSVANTLAIQPVGATENLAPQAELAGLLFDVTGQMFGLFENGQYGRIDLTTGAIAGLAQSNIPLGNGQLWGDMAGIALEGTPPPDPLSLTVATENNVPAQITTAGGQLRMTANVLPADASQSVQWSVTVADGLATVDNTGLVTALEDGTVFIKATAAGFPQVTDSMAVQISHQDTTTAIGTPAALPSLLVYPNPASGRLYIRTTDRQPVQELLVTDMAGRECLRRYTGGGGSILSLDVSTLPQGIYLLRASGRDFRLVQRISIQHDGRR